MTRRLWHAVLTGDDRAIEALLFSKAMRRRLSVMVGLTCFGWTSLLLAWLW